MGDYLLDPREEKGLLDVLLHQRPQQVGGGVQQRPAHSKQSMQSSRSVRNRRHGRCNHNGQRDGNDRHAQRQTFQPEGLATLHSKYECEQKPGGGYVEEYALRGVSGPDGGQDKGVSQS